jgi:hypothetical protein
MYKIRTLKYLCIAFAYLTLIKCNSTKLIKTKNKIKIDSSLVNLLNGKYLNNSTDTNFLKTHFWQHLHSNRNKSNDSNFNINGKYFELSIFGKSTIYFNLLDSNLKVLSSLKYRYVIKNGIVLIKTYQNKLVEGIPLVCYRTTEETLNLAIDNSNNLLLGCDGSIVSGVFVIQVGISINGNYIFKRQ